MKKSTLIYLAVAAAGYAYYTYYTKKKKEKSSTKIVKETIESLPMAEAEKPPVRQEPKLLKQLPLFAYNKKTTIKPVAKTLDTIKNAIFAQKAKPFSLNPAGKKAATKQKTKKAKLGELGATYLYV